MNKSIYLLSIILLFTFCSNGYSDNSKISAVYQTVVNRIIINDKMIIALSEDSEEYKPPFEGISVSLLQKYIPDISKNLANDFIINNKKVISIKNYFNGTNQVHSLPPEDYSSIQSISHKFKVLHESLPNFYGMYSFSNIGFNQDNTQAILYVYYDCGSLCGSGSFYILKKENNIWEVESIEQIYVS